MNQEERTKEFLEALSKLSRRYDIAIEGCGCCGSPALWDEKDQQLILDKLKWDEESGVYRTGQTS